MGTSTIEWYRRPTPAARRALALVLFAVALAFVGVRPAASQDLTRGREIFQLCATCHGPSGGGNQLYHAPAIGGLPTWYVEAQLTKFREGLRGGKPGDTTGLQMRPMTRALTQPGDIRAVAAYIATLKPPRPTPTVRGDAARGKATYALCMACHGDHAQGNQAIGAPPLAGQPDWYLVAQLDKFRQGLRGYDPRDPTGSQMRPMAMTLGNEQAIGDVVAYIRTLGH